MPLDPKHVTIDVPFYGDALVEAMDVGAGAKATPMGVPTCRMFFRHRSPPSIKTAGSISQHKNHIGVDRRHKFVRRYAVSDASVHDSQKLEDVIDANNAASDVWADSAYRSDEIEEKPAERGLKSRIHRRAYRHRKLSEAQKAANKARSKVRARVEHVFADQKNGMGAGLVRTIGIVRARCKIGMTNLVYNMRRFVCLERMAAAAG
jgi:IS5 family transposase